MKVSDILPALSFPDKKRIKTGECNMNALARAVITHGKPARLHIKEDKRVDGKEIVIKLKFTRIIKHKR